MLLFFYCSDCVLSIVLFSISLILSLVLRSVLIVVLICVAVCLSSALFPYYDFLISHVSSLLVEAFLRRLLRVLIRQPHHPRRLGVGIG